MLKALGGDELGGDTSGIRTGARPRWLRVCRALLLHFAAAHVLMVCRRERPKLLLTMGGAKGTRTPNPLLANNVLGGAGCGLAPNGWCSWQEPVCKDAQPLGSGWGRASQRGSIRFPTERLAACHPDCARQLRSAAAGVDQLRWTRSAAPLHSGPLRMAHERPDSRTSSIALADSGGKGDMADVFFGYPVYPNGPAEVMRATAKQLEAWGVKAQTWQSLHVDGRVVISKVLQAIDEAKCGVFDLTYLNSNVAFELAYCLARGKPVRIILDGSVSEAIPKFNELSTLKAVGYTKYFNSPELAAHLMSTAPWNDQRAAYDDLIEPSLPEVSDPRNALLYCPTYDPFEASSRLSTFVDDRRKSGSEVIVSDPRESSFEPITWLAPSIMRSAGVLVHFAGDHRNRSGVINTRHALTAGLAHGLDTPILMLGEPEYKVPFDYEGILKTYRFARECVQYAREWFDLLEFEQIDWQRPRRAPRNPLTLLKFGEHVAENELNELPDYFVETSAFNDVIDTRDTIYVGHRGTGKTANAIQALDRLRANKTILAVLIKPPAFEFPAMFEAVLGLPVGQRDYFFDALWRFVIQTEIGYAVLQMIESRGPSVPMSAAEEGFLSYVTAAPFDLRADISTRLEQTLNHLSTRVAGEGSAPETRRDLINEAFHTKALNGLRAALGGVLKDRKRVAILVDNLDKGWDRNADLALMARFILGLLVARGNVLRDFDRQDWWRNRVRLTVSIFLRSDIYHYLRTEAREPDKLPLSTVKWDDPSTLLHLLETRYEARSRRPGTDVWARVFPPSVDGMSTRDFITSTVQPRPRDLVVLANAAIASAIDRGNTVITANDLITARKVYSDYAFDALLVENGVTIPELNDALYSLLGSPSVLTRSDIHILLENAGIPSERIEAVVDKLLSVCLIGFETHDNEFVFPEVGRDADRARALAAKHEPDRMKRRFRIHNAYHPYLDITASTS